MRAIGLVIDSVTGGVNGPFIISSRILQGTALSLFHDSTPSIRPECQGTRSRRGDSDDRSSPKSARRVRQPTADLSELWNWTRRQAAEGRMSSSYSSSTPSGRSARLLPVPASNSRTEPGTLRVGIRRNLFVPIISLKASYRP